MHLFSYIIEVSMKSVFLYETDIDELMSVCGYIRKYIAAVQRHSQPRQHLDSLT